MIRNNILKVATIIFLLIIFVPQWAKAQKQAESVELYINQQLIKDDHIAMLYDSHIYVSYPSFFNQIGEKAIWNTEENTLSFSVNGKRTELWLNQAQVWQDGKSKVYDCQMIIYEGEIKIPIKIMADLLEYKLQWDGKKKAVFLEKSKIEISQETGKSQKRPIPFYYKQDKLEQMVQNYSCAESVRAFRQKENPRRKGLLKYEGKFCDMYYPDTEKAHKTVQLLSLHLDKIYMMLYDLYDVKAPVEVHLIGEKEAQGLREGEIRRRENVTFIWLEDTNDGIDGINNISELVHEMNHNFFAAVNGGSSNEMWLNEAHAKLISSLYCLDLPENEEIDMSRLYERIASSEERMSLEKDDIFLRKEQAWGKVSGDLRKAQATGMTFWQYIYQTSSEEEFKRILRNLGNRNVIKAIESLMGKKIEAIQSDFDKWG